MKYNLLKILIVIYLFIYFIQFIDCYEMKSIKGACHTCRWVKYRFPSTTECIYYQKPIEIAIKNCTDYRINMKLIKKSL